MKIRTIRSGSENFNLHDTGEISRPAIGMGPSGEWRVVGAVTRNNFGCIVSRWTLADILGGALIPWRWKNGKQRTFIRDFDHGTIREWRAPDHEVY